LERTFGVGLLGGRGFGGWVAGGRLIECLMGDERLCVSLVGPGSGRLSRCLLGDGRLCRCLVGGGSLLASLKVEVEEGLGIGLAIREKLGLRVWH